MINRLIEPTGGRIFLDGEDVTHVDPVELRRRIGYVIQQVGLFPHQTIGDNIATVPKLLGWNARPDRRTRSTSCSRLVGLDPARTATATRRSCRAVSASASASPARWPPTRRCC